MLSPERDSCTVPLSASILTTGGRDMAALDSVLSILDKFPLWRRIKEAPDKLDALDERVTGLEEKLGDTWPADVCRYCGKRAARLHLPGQANGRGVVREMWRCQKCGKLDERSYKAK